MEAFGLLPDGRLLVSTLGNVSVTGASGADEVLLAFTPTALGSTTSGTWAMYWDGSLSPTFSSPFSHCLPFTARRDRSPCPVDFS